jgi:hypothetical protein
VYVANSDLKESEKKVLTTKILAPFVKSGEYRAIERSDAFLNGIAREREKQRDGSVDDNQISRLGKEAGVQFVCIADLVDAFGVYSVSARLINTETAEIVGIGETEMKNLNEIGKAADEIFEQISGSKNGRKITSSQKQALEKEQLKQVSLEDLQKKQEWKDIKADFPTNQVFFNVAENGFSEYFKRHNPRMFSKDDESLVMIAKYKGNVDIKCTFFKDSYKRFILVMESELSVRDKTKLIKSLAEYVEKLSKKK